MTLMDKQPGVFFINYRLLQFQKIQLLVFLTIMKKKNF